MEATEKIYIYQPTDEENRPIGGKQVIKYTTQEELVEKLREQNTLLIRKLRKETKNNRLGIFEEEKLPENVQRFNSPVEFAPREISADEYTILSQQLLDPATAAQAHRTLVEAGLGAPLDSIGKTLREVQQDNINLRAKIEANAFVAETPEYFKCEENFQAIASWMIRYDLAPVKENYKKAYETLKAQGVLIEGPAPIVEVVVPVTPVVLEPVVPTPPVPPAPVVRPPSGLTREEASDAGTPVLPGSDIEYTYQVQIGMNGKTPIMKTITLTGLAAINAMSGEEYGRRIRTDKDFAKKVEALERENKKPRA